jgi:hypothetical protein
VLLLPNKFRFRKLLKYSVVGIVISVAAYFIATL